MRELFKYEVVGDSCIFFLNSVIDKQPIDKREKYRREIINNLEKYVFIGRKVTDSPHPESMSLKNKRKVVWKDLDYEKPEDAIRAIVTIILPYYVAETQNRTRKYIINNL